MQWVPFLLYVFVTSFTPGPNTMMSMAYASQLGFQKTLRFILGVTLGTTILSLVSSYFNLVLHHYIPQIQLWLSIVGIAYMVYLAVKIMLSKPGEKSNEPGNKTLFLSGVLIQFINPKAILYAITVIPMFVLPTYASYESLFLFALFFGFVGFMSCTSWAVCGALFQRFVNRHQRVLNVVMGLLLMYSAFSMLPE
ncbi:LysE family translocator [Brevibacillus sp. TJ4]|uniref:LysE family translocator n=1 Tax=Brevibacillus sp. TJ4 TaxID=3234853 RepID=UPI0037D3A2EE